MSVKYERASNNSEADSLRSEAKSLLNCMFKIPEGFSDNTIDRIVDCIIGSALLEIASLQKQARI
jgi:hypothetical protein